MDALKIAALSLVLTSAAVAADDCTNPAAPNLPDGASSNMEQMIAGQKAVKAFQADNISYMECLDALITRAEKQTKEGTDDDMIEAQKVYDESEAAYNAAVSAEESVADQFNSEVRAYKAANPK